MQACLLFLVTLFVKYYSIGSCNVFYLSVELDLGCLPSLTSNDNQLLFMHYDYFVYFCCLLLFLCFFSHLIYL